jgi:hypothetical protein
MACQIYNITSKDDKSPINPTVNTRPVTIRSLTSRFKRLVHRIRGVNPNRPVGLSCTLRYITRTLEIEQGGILFALHCAASEITDAVLETTCNLREQMKNYWLRIFKPGFRYKSLSHKTHCHNDCYKFNYINTQSHKGNAVT